MLDDARPADRPLVGPRPPLVGPRRSRRRVRLVPGHRVRLVLAGAVLSALLAVALVAHPAQRTAPAGTSGATPPPVAEVDGGTPAPASVPTQHAVASSGGGAPRSTTDHPRTGEPRATPSSTSSAGTAVAPAAEGTAGPAAPASSSAGAAPALGAPPAGTTAPASTVAAATGTAATDAEEPDPSDQDHSTGSDPLLPGS